MKKRTAKRPIKDRAFELDFVRGLCISLMMLEHFLVAACLVFWDFWWDYIPRDGIIFKLLSIGDKIYLSPWKETLRGYVIAVFFIVAGLSAAFSRKKYNGLLKTSLFAGGLTLVTFIVSEITGSDQFLVTHGVFHIFAVCYLFYFITVSAVKDKFIRSAIFLTGGTFFILLHVWTENGLLVWNDSFISALFVDKIYFISWMDNVFIIPWAGFFLLGAAASPLLYPHKTSLLPRLNAELNAPLKLKNILLKAVVKPINFIGRHPVFFYAFNIIASILLLILFGVIFIGVEWITDAINMF
ncbi:MAG: DUF1624 domain-containing protein [Clostridiales bacterium]|jgi:uncharacterized membrane protein|nr:DUF1624 domain-containing protein [Clostridiales bacterium]